MARILCVEDNDSYRELLANELRKEGYHVDDVDSPVKGLEYLVLHDYDLVISDLKLPVMSGVTFTESVKNVKPNTPCIILTGDSDDQSEIQSIHNNIDLYLEKSRSLKVILEYVRKLLDGRDFEHEEVVLVSKNEGIVLYTDQHKVTMNDELLDLTPTEFEILKLFLSNKNRVLTREDILDMVWQEPTIDIEVRVVDSHIRKLRDKIQAFSLMTVRGYGYKWNEIE